MTQFLDYEGLKTFAKTIDSKFVRKDGLDITFAEVVTSLPTDITKIKKHLYLVKNASSTESQNIYSEYIYIGEIGTGKTYDSSKWEKLGEVTAKIDLSDYSTKSETIKSIEQNVHTSGIDQNVYLTITNADGDATDIGISAASRDNAGVMTVTDFNKLKDIDPGANKTVVDNVLNASSDNPVQNKVIKAALEGKADSDIGVFTSGVATPVLDINANTASEPSKNKIYATGENGTADIIVQHANSTGAIDEVVKVNVDGIVVNEYSHGIAIGNINNLDWTLTGNKTNITGKSVTSPKIVKTGGTSQQALMADGSVKDINDIVKYGTTVGTACQGNDARLNTGTNVRVNGIALGNASKNINTNGFYVIDDITTKDFPGGSTTSNVSRTIYCKGYLLGSLNGNPVNNYPNKEQFGIVEKVNNTISLPKAPINALYFNKTDGLLYYNAGTELRKIFDDVNEACQIGATLGFLSASDYDTIMGVVDGAPTEAITSAEIEQLFA